jgi:hypothetical protein
MRKLPVLLVGALIAGPAVALEPEDYRALMEKECSQYPYGNEVRGRCEKRILDRERNEIQTKMSLLKASLRLSL